MIILAGMKIHSSWVLDQKSTSCQQTKLLLILSHIFKITPVRFLSIASRLVLEKNPRESAISGAKRQSWCNIHRRAQRDNIYQNNVKLVSNWYQINITLKWIHRIYLTMGRRKITEKAQSQTGNQTDNDSERKVLTQRMPSNLVTRVDKLADELRMSRNAAINLMMKRRIEEWKWELLLLNLFH